MPAMRLDIPVTMFAACLFSLAPGCDISSAETSSDDTEPPFQDLDGGDHWPDDTDEDETDGPELALVIDDDDGDDTSEDDAGWCLDIGWESYQVAGSCPDLPSTGAIVQDDCQIEIPGELGNVLGASGAVSGPQVTTTSCTGIAEDSDLPSVELTCLVDEASCAVELSGGTSGW